MWQKDLKFVDQLTFPGPCVFQSNGVLGTLPEKSYIMTENKELASFYCYPTWSTIVHYCVWCMTNLQRWWKLDFEAKTDKGGKLKFLYFTHPSIGIDGCFVGS